MFDMGFTEMMLIGIVALVVIGPERLPGVARTAGKYFSRLRNFVSDVRTDVENELKADELREMFDAQRRELESLKQEADNVVSDVGLGNTGSETGVVNSILDQPMADLELEQAPEPDAVSEAKPAIAAKSAGAAAKSAKPAIAEPK